MRLTKAANLFCCAISTGVFFVSSLAFSASAPTVPSTASEPVPQNGAQAAGSGGESAQDLANQVNNPNAPLMQFQLRDVVAPDLPGTNGGTGNLLQFLGVLPIPPSKVLPFAQLIKITIPIVTLPQPVSETGLSDINLFDVAVFKESWGSWGVGPTLVFPTASRIRSVLVCIRSVRRRQSCTPGSRTWFAVQYSRIQFLMQATVVQ